MAHIPVMVPEVLELLLFEGSRMVLDGTVGCGGHAEAVLQANEQVRLIGMDRDERSLAIAKERLKKFGSRVLLFKASYTELDSLLSAEAEGGRVDGILLDLGVSSYQLDDADRGFSYMQEGPLDMRMGADEKTARDVIAEADTGELARMLKAYGEVSRAAVFARVIKDAEKRGEMVTTLHLRRAVETAAGNAASPALLSKIFQAIRLVVNQELENLEQFLGGIFRYANPQARMVFISYHSLEDRVVKQFFKTESSFCICPPETPECVCNHKPRLKLLTKRTLKPFKPEIAVNPRARSARLRAAQVL